MARFPSSCSATWSSRRSASSPYFITLGPHGFYWFSLESDPVGRRPPLARFRVGGRWDDLLEEPAVRQLQEYLPTFIGARRWFGSKARTIASVEVVDTVLVPMTDERAGGPPLAHLAVVRVEMDYGSPERYLLPLAFVAGEEAEELRRWRPEAVIADLRAGDDDGVLVDAVWLPELSRAVLEVIGRRRSLPGRNGRLIGAPSASFRRLRNLVGPDLPASPISAEQSNSSVAFGDRAIVKFLRRFEEGVNPGVEIGRFLSERAHFRHSPANGGTSSTDPREGAPRRWPSLEEFVPNEGDGWSYVVDALEHGLEEALAHSDAEELRMAAPRPAPQRRDPGARTRARPARAPPPMGVLARSAHRRAPSRSGIRSRVIPTSRPSR